MEITSARFIKGIIGTNEILNEKRPQIAFVGRSNVGKSSLINSLVRQKNLVRSSSYPGCTKEINFFLINEGLYFVDLPGYGYAKFSQKNRDKLIKMILWYLVSKEAKIKKVVHIIDAEIGLKKFDFEMLSVLRENNLDYIIVANKMDKIKPSQKHKKLKAITDALGGEEILLYSTFTGQGREELLSHLLKY